MKYKACRAVTRCKDAKMGQIQSILGPISLSQILKKVGANYSGGDLDFFGTGLCCPKSWQTTLVYGKQAQNIQPWSMETYMK